MSRAPLRFPATARHTATVIFVHGLGDSGHGWAAAVENWRRRQRLDEVKFILPHAPSIPITINGGMKMPGWYDIVDLGGSLDAMRRSEDAAGIVRSQEYLHSLIQQEMDAGIPAERIVLGGFSQGGAMSLFAGLTARVRLAGIVAMSSYLLLGSKLGDYLPSPELNRATPILMAHGTADAVVGFPVGRMSYEMVKQRGYNVTMKIYEGMGHDACPEELDDIEAFLRERLPALDQSTGKAEL
ncbi:hypothetical protein QBC33DRAFT_448385 [Phialemonium atrogriseum]|uniref:Acyl-protein thioesterase 1 n=1 Tax=Phialemonium atrogriseum TaxID=1093897 RepID=A0AAJ0FN09_9PEZI|nr:uncharacterized protein QBC33DRAFT_448385 [Phialemonium atrogriseum]KAK1768808.1 hypothetical protein QBC33DRAFT_448385 [Phialemonium atrogriseum]